MEKTCSWIIVYDHIFVDEILMEIVIDGISKTRLGDFNQIVNDIFIELSSMK